MPELEWNIEKNEQLKTERDISFEEIVDAITKGQLLDTIPHPNQEQYPNQRIYFVRLKDYVYVVPFVRDGDVNFLKTAIPSRKATRDYLRS